MTKIGVAGYAVAVTAAAAGAVAAARALRGEHWTWTLASGRDGLSVELMKVPGWVVMLGEVGELLPCLHAARAWPWKIGYGRDEDGDPARSLGHALVWLCDRHSGVGWGPQHVVHALPIDTATLHKLDPGTLLGGG